MFKLSCSLREHFHTTGRDLCQVMVTTIKEMDSVIKLIVLKLDHSMCAVIVDQEISLLAQTTKIKNTKYSFIHTWQGSSVILTTKVYIRDLQ